MARESIRDTASAGDGDRARPSGARAAQGRREREIAALVRLVRTIVDESGDPAMAKAFDAAAWLEGWLQQPNPALGGELPSAWLGRAGGPDVLRALIMRAQSGAYA
ncbi:hypothetical protein LMG24235_04548 [Paraburkholderia sabiae]|nr:hypothetical protein LMG24235_04548 [Paraburkholderia sabiae]